MNPNHWLDQAMFPSFPCHRPRLFKELKNKSVLITGASSGIGKELAYILADADIHLILVARRKDLLDAIRLDLSLKKARVVVLPADLRVEEEMEKVLERLFSLPGGLDVVVSNAGISINRPIYQSLDRYHDFTRTMAINYFAPVRLLLSVIPMLEKNKGHIVNVSTINTLMAPMLNWAAYQSSKSAFDTWLRSAAPELGLRGITASTIYLPLVKTPMIEPTLAYRKAPAIRAVHAAELIAKTFYTKKRTVRPWWMIPAEAASIFIRQTPIAPWGGSSRGRH